MKSLFRKKCEHEFRLDDLEKTNIPEPERPKDTSYKVLLEYYANKYKHDWYTKRVKWPCYKCGEIFYAHCGLDIIPKYGKVT